MHQSLPLMREVAKPKVLTEGEKFLHFFVNSLHFRNFFSPPVSFADSPLVRGGREALLHR